MLIYYIVWIMSYIGDTLRIGGRTCSDYWNLLPVNIISYPMPDKDPPDPIRYSTTKSRESKRLLILGLMVTYSKACSFPNIDLSV